MCKMCVNFMVNREADGDLLPIDILRISRVTYLIIYVSEGLGVYNGLEIKQYNQHVVILWFKDRNHVYIFLL